MAKRITPGDKGIETEQAQKESPVKINPHRKRELHDMVNKKKKRFVNIIRDWVQGDKKDDVVE